jgi:hypothetical protein
MRHRAVNAGFLPTVARLHKSALRLGGNRMRVEGGHARKKIDHR